MGAFRRFAVLVFLVTNPPAFAADPLAGSALYADVQRYDGFGVHRYGSPGAEQAMAWIAGEFERAGLAVSSQRFTLARQYEFESGTLTVDMGLTGGVKVRSGESVRELIVARRAGFLISLG